MAELKEKKRSMNSESVRSNDCRDLGAALLSGSAEQEREAALASPPLRTRSGNSTLTSSFRYPREAPVVSLPCHL
jgi:hypothetical protein